MNSDECRDREREHEEMVVGGVIVCVSLLVLSAIICVIQHIIEAVQ